MLARGWRNEAKSTSFHLFRDQEELILGRRRVLENDRGISAFGHHVGALLHRHRRHRGHGFYAAHVDLGELLDEREDRVELGLQVLDFFVGDRDAGEMRDAADGRGVNGHGGFLSARMDPPWWRAPYSRDAFRPAMNVAAKAGWRAPRLHAGPRSMLNRRACPRLSCRSPKSRPTCRIGAFWSVSISAPRPSGSRLSLPTPAPPPAVSTVAATGVPPPHGGGGASHKRG